MLKQAKELIYIQDLMKKFPHPWFIGGGWALDIAAGQVTREHEDLDICILREHTEAVFSYFSDWDIKIAIPGEHRLEPCTTLQDTLAPRYGLHLHRSSEFVEILLTDKTGDVIPFRRHPDIQLDYTRFARVDANGLPYVAPEWQLLFKAKEGRAKDLADFLHHAPLLDEQAKRWLYDALSNHLPQSEWLPLLKTMQGIEPSSSQSGGFIGSLITKELLT